MNDKGKKEAFKLLSEIFNTLSKYDDDIFNLAMSILNDKQMAKSLELMNSKTSNNAKRRGMLSHSEQEKKEILASISSKLRSRERFPTLDSMRNFMRNQKNIGIELLDLKNRNSLTRTYLQHIQNLPLEGLYKINDSITKQEHLTIDENNDRSLENWSKIILKKSKDD